MIILKTICVFILACAFANAQQPADCHNVAGQNVIYDPDCQNGGIGCNAGGLGLLCRFCFSVPDKCAAASASTAVPTMPTTLKPVVATTTFDGTCPTVNGRQSILDPSCNQCDAGGILECRFCGADGCSDPVETTQPPRTTQQPPISTTVPTVKPTPVATTRKMPTLATTAPASRCSSPDTALTQTSCSAEESASCNCQDGFYCCLEGRSSLPVHGCNPAKWTSDACSCACLKGGLNPTDGPTGGPDTSVRNCTYDEYINNWCGLDKGQHYYCITTGECEAEKFVCDNMCWVEDIPPLPVRPKSNGTYTPGALSPQSVTCGSQTVPRATPCDVQPNDPKWLYKGTRDGECQGTYKWCPSGDGFIPSKYQCGPTIMNTPQCPLRTTLESQKCMENVPYDPPSWAPQPVNPNIECDTVDDDVCVNIHNPNHCVGCCQANEWPWTPRTGCATFWQQNPHGGKCRHVTPQFNWILTTCDTAGGIVFAGACHQNPFSRADVRYVAAYQFTKKANGQFVWSLVQDSSLNWNGEAKYANLGALPTEQTGTGPVNSCSGGGGGWNTAFFPYKVNGLSPPAFMFVLSYERLENAAWFMLNQKILNNGPGESTCEDPTNCWGEISAGEIDFLETPNLFPDQYKTASGWNVFHTTSYNAANRCWSCNHAFQANASLNQNGCGGATANTFYDANQEEDYDNDHVFVAVIDARGTTMYKDPVWPGISKTCVAEELVNLHPEEPEQQQACNDPKKTCAVFLSGCVTHVTPEMVQLTNGDVSRIPQCYRIDAANHVTCTSNWWDLMMDTGQWYITDPGMSEL